MKVLQKAVIALALAAPLNLVSADESVTNIDIPVLGKGGHNYFQDSKEGLISTIITIEAMTYEDVVVLAPRLEGPHVVDYITAKAPLNINQDDLSGSTEVAFNKAKKYKDLEIQ